MKKRKRGVNIFNPPALDENVVQPAKQGDKYITSSIKVQHRSINFRKSNFIKKNPLKVIQKSSNTSRSQNLCIPGSGLNMISRTTCESRDRD